VGWKRTQPIFQGEGDRRNGRKEGGLDMLNKTQTAHPVVSDHVSTATHLLPFSIRDCSSRVRRGAATRGDKRGVLKGGNGEKIRGDDGKQCHGNRSAYKREWALAETRRPSHYAKIRARLNVPCGGGGQTDLVRGLAGETLD